MGDKPPAEHEAKAVVTRAMGLAMVVRIYSPIAVT